MDKEIKITLRMPAALHALIKDMAAEQQRSLNGQLLVLLRAGVEDAIGDRRIVGGGKPTTLLDP